MSGIFGIIHRDGRPVEVADLERMRVAMAHRGPDGSAIWRAGEAGLGQLMLHSTPESLHETLPWQDPESGLVITADARIDNRDELAAMLGLSVRRPQSGLLQGAVGGRFAGDASSMIPDSQFILEAYKRWGDACVDHLLGDFAFAIWNPRDRQLFCARDHMGIRPFYYYLDERVFVFASSALGVVAAPAAPRQINRVRIADYLVYDLEGADKTCSWFKKVLRLPPARIGVLDSREWCTREYWQPDPETELKLGSDEEYIDAFEEVFTSAVAARLRSHKRVASMLSGGLDSSTIVGIARKPEIGRQPGPLITFSGVSDRMEDCRESRYSGMVIAQGGFEAHRLRPADVPLFADRLRSLHPRIEDGFDMNWIHHQMLYLAAREEGCAAVLDGTDGGGVASLTGVYPSLLMKQGHWLVAHREIRGLWENAYQKSFPLWKEYWAALRPLMVPQTLGRLKNRLGKNANDRLAAEYMIDPVFAREHGLAERMHAYREAGNMLTCGTLREAHVRRIMAPYVTAGIERYGRLAASCGTEARSPFFDLRLIRFAISLPWHLKVRDGWFKYGLRKVAERTLPHEVAWRPGWESILWKFWYAWDDLVEEQNRSLYRSGLNDLNGVMSSGEYTNLSSGIMIGSLDMNERRRSIKSLLRWLPNLRSHDDI